MLLGHLLWAAGVDIVILERHDRTYVEGRVRAGVLEQITVDLMERLGLGARMRREGLVHAGTNIAHDDEMFRVDMQNLTGVSVMVYGQQEVMKDLFDAAESSGPAIIFNAEGVTPQDIEIDRPFVTWRADGAGHRWAATAITGLAGPAFQHPC